MKSEFLYIIYRRAKAKVSSLCFLLFRIFPIDTKLVSVCSFEGKGAFGCNPKYIVKRLHEENPSIKFVWFMNKNIMDKDMPEYIKKVPNTLLSRAFWLTRSKIWIDNYRKPYGTKKRKGQIYFNTWHGMVGFKTIGLWRGNSFSKIAYLVSKNDSDMVDFFLSDSRFTKEYMPKGLLYDGEFLQAGSPRCDVLLNNVDERKLEFKEKYGIPMEDKCIMYAPTFRESKSVDGKRTVFANSSGIDFDKVLKNMTKKFGGKWHLCVRLHPQVKDAEIHLNESAYIDLSQEDDMNENLAAMDALITDYSSCAMDAEMMHIPIFIYSNDMEEYQEKRGDFVWKLSGEVRADASINKSILPMLDVKLPFSLAHNNEELEEDILKFDIQRYLEKLCAYEDGIELIKDGRASEKVVKKIQEYM